jgi:hypothetical protein
MKKLVVLVSVIFSLLACGTEASSAVFKMKNSNQQDIWIAVAAWMTQGNNTNSSAKVHAGFYKLVPGESRIFFDNAAYQINTAYAAIAYEVNGQLQYVQPKAGTGAGAQYFDLSISNCTAFGNKYTCDVWAQVLGGILTSGGMRLHFPADSGVISHIKSGKTIRFVGQKTSSVVPNDMDQ